MNYLVYRALPLFWVGTAMLFSCHSSDKDSNAHQQLIVEHATLEANHEKGAVPDEQMVKDHKRLKMNR